MTNGELKQKYYELVDRAMTCAEKARREGLLALEEMLDEKKIAARDIFEYGMRFVLDGTDQSYVEKILGNLMAREKDESTRVFKEMQKDAVLSIQAGDNPRIMYAILNSRMDTTVEEDRAALKDRGWDDLRYIS